jgi:hypothetical protein
MKRWAVAAAVLVASCVTQDIPDVPGVDAQLLGRLTCEELDDLAAETARLQLAVEKEAKTTTAEEWINPLAPPANDLAIMEARRAADHRAYAVWQTSLAKGCPAPPQPVCLGFEYSRDCQPKRGARKFTPIVSESALTSP